MNCGSEPWKEFALYELVNGEDALLEEEPENPDDDLPDEEDEDVDDLLDEENDDE